MANSKKARLLSAITDKSFASRLGAFSFERISNKIHLWSGPSKEIIDELQTEYDRRGLGKVPTNRDFAEKFVREHAHEGWMTLQSYIEQEDPSLLAEIEAYTVAHPDESDPIWIYLSRAFIEHWHIFSAKLAKAEETWVRAGRMVALTQDTNAAVEASLATYPDFEWVEYNLSGSEFEETVIALISTTSGSRFKIPKRHVVGLGMPDFYRDSGLVSIRDREKRPRWQYYGILSLNTHRLYSITRNIQTIYDVNDKGLLTLDETNVLDYAKFVMKLAHGPFGRTEFIEQLLIDWGNRSASEIRVHQAVVDTRIPPQLLPKKQDGRWIVNGCVEFATNSGSSGPVFGQLFISESGRVELDLWKIWKDYKRTQGFDDDGWTVEPSEQRAPSRDQLQQ